MKVATIDIGTNTTRLAIVNSENFQVVDKRRVVTRLGEGFDNYLTETAQKRVIDVLKDYSQVIKKYDVDKFRGVATSVVREAKNGEDFISRVYKESGLQIDIIEGKEEAELTFYGVLGILDKSIKNFILLDIGGGSNEFTFVKDRVIQSSISLKFGVVFLYEKFINSDPPSVFNINALEKEIGVNIAKVNDLFSKYTLSEIDNLKFVGTAGTITTLAAIHLGLREYLPEIVNNHSVPLFFVEELLEKMKALTNSGRREIFHIEKGREDVIIPGLLIVKKSLEHFGCQDITVIDSGLLEGIAWKLLNI